MTPSAKIVKSHDSVTNCIKENPVAVEKDHRELIKIALRNFDQRNPQGHQV